MLTVPVDTTPLADASFHIIEAHFRATTPHCLPRPFCDSTMGPFQTTRVSMLTLRDADGTEGHAWATNAAILESLLLPKLLTSQPTSY
ncbi:MAG TPA: hypothetical protein VG722_13555, partial [Tepidisphaeraceae bacterium]|nr:hypothetical protein [Tepidisphaeraceae bacterium]